jgi:group I intron endonuclease
MNYFIYITTNKVNNKKYVGLCKSNKKNVDTYLGSGKLLNKAIKKYGVDNFYRNIIEYHENLDDAIQAEKTFILENGCHISDDWYNIAISFTTQGFKGKKQTEKHKFAMQKLLTNIPRKEKSKKKQSETRKRNIKEGKYSFNNHTEDQLKIISNIGKSNFGRKHKKKKCIYCNKKFGPAPYSRFHDKNCKSYQSPSISDIIK